MGKIGSLAALMRPHQYLKNLFVFAPMLFGMRLVDQAAALASLAAFAAFSLCASAIYVFNDLRDIEADRAHPVKRGRPLACGAVSPAEAWGLLVVLACAGMALASSLPLGVPVSIAVYVSLNILYSLQLKHIALVDITVIALGFVIRLFAGSYAAGIPLSPWIILTTFLLALFLALAKRRDDELLYIKSGKRMRQVGEGYNLEFINAGMCIMCAVVLVAYVMYTLQPETRVHWGTDKLYLSVVFVVLGILRYLQMTFVYKNSGSPTKVVMRDRFLQAVILGWVAFFIVLFFARRGA